MGTQPHASKVSRDPAPPNTTACIHDFLVSGTLQLNLRILLHCAAEPPREQPKPTRATPPPLPEGLQGASSCRRKLPCARGDRDCWAPAATAGRAPLLPVPRRAPSLYPGPPCGRDSPGSSRTGTGLVPSRAGLGCPSCGCCARHRPHLHQAERLSWDGVGQPATTAWRDSAKEQQLTGGARNFQPLGFGHSSQHLILKGTKLPCMAPSPQGEERSLPLPLDTLLSREAQCCSRCRSPGGIPGTWRRQRQSRHSTAPAEPSLQPGQVPEPQAGSEEGRVGAAFRTSCSLWFAVTSDNFFHTIMSSDHNNQSLRKWYSFSTVRQHGWLLPEGRKGSELQIQSSAMGRMTDKIYSGATLQ